MPRRADGRAGGGRRPRPHEHAHDLPVGRGRAPSLRGDARRGAARLHTLADRAGGGGITGGGMSITGRRNQMCHGLNSAGGIGRALWRPRECALFILLVAACPTGALTPAAAQSKPSVYQATLQEPNQKTPEVTTEELQKLLAGGGVPLLD